MLVKFSCGCIGLTNVQGDEERPSVVIHPCDLNHPECWEPLGFQRRDMSDKGHEPLSGEEAVKLLEELNLLVAEGYALRQMKAILGR